MPSIFDVVDTNLEGDVKDEEVGNDVSTFSFPSMYAVIPCCVDVTGFCG